MPPQSREGLAGALRAVGMLARAGGVRDAAGRASPLKHAGLPFVQGADGLSGGAGGGFSSPRFRKRISQAELVRPATGRESLLE